MLIHSGCDFSYVWVDPDGVAEKDHVTSCIPSLPGEGHISDYIEDTEAVECPEYGCDPIPTEYYCPLKSTFGGHRNWAVCSGGCFDENKGT